MPQERSHKIVSIWDQFRCFSPSSAILSTPTEVLPLLLLFFPGDLAWFIEAAWRLSKPIAPSPHLIRKAPATEDGVSILNRAPCCWNSNAQRDGLPCLRLGSQSWKTLSETSRWCYSHHQDFSLWLFDPCIYGKESAGKACLHLMFMCELASGIDYSWKQEERETGKGRKVETKQKNLQGCHAHLLYLPGCLNASLEAHGMALSITAF